MTSNVVSSGKDSSFLYSPSKVQQYFETCKKIREKVLEKVTGKGEMFISARKYKKDETVSDYSDSFVSSRHRIKRKEL